MACAKETNECDTARADALLLHAYARDVRGLHAFPNPERSALVSDRVLPPLAQIVESFLAPEIVTVNLTVKSNHASLDGTAHVLRWVRVPDEALCYVWFGRIRDTDTWDDHWASLVSHCDRMRPFEPYEGYEMKTDNRKSAFFLSLKWRAPPAVVCHLSSDGGDTSHGHSLTMPRNVCPNPDVQKMWDFLHIWLPDRFPIDLSELEGWFGEDLWELRTGHGQG
jgi:hypothetical protein